MHGICADSTVIKECIFSFYLTGTAGNSYIDFGTVNPEIETKPDESAWIDIEKNPWWSSKLNGFRWGAEYSDTTEYKIPEKNAITDTGSSCIIGPKAIIGYIEEKIRNTSNSMVSDPSWGYLFDCADKAAMPSFELLFGGYWFKVNPEDYVLQATASKCVLCFMTDETYWILGDVFLRGWYSMHNLDKM